MVHLQKSVLLFLIVQEPRFLNHQQVVLLVVLLLKLVQKNQHLVVLKFELVFVMHLDLQLVVQVLLNFAVLR